MTRPTLYTILSLVALLVIAGSAAAFVAVQASPSAVLSAPISAPTLTANPDIREVVYRIIPAESQARFAIDETYYGARHTVVGSTDQVAGDILLNADSPAQSRLGVIRINARALTTDNFFRTIALRERLLLSNMPEYEFIEFVPQSIDGLLELSERFVVGERHSLQITGVLTLRNVPQMLTFDVMVVPVSAFRLQGTASAAVDWADFGIVMPRAPGISDVDETVRLELDFTAEVVDS